MIRKRVAVRAYTEPDRWRPSRVEDRTIWTPPADEYALAFDTETTVDAAQGLLLGVYRVLRLIWSATVCRCLCLEEGLFFPEEWSESAPSSVEILRAYARAHRPEVAAASQEAGATPARADLRLLTRGQFVSELLLPAIHSRSRVVAFNAPFDFSRIALGWVDPRRQFRGGFKLVLSTYRSRSGEERPKVWLRTKSAGPKRQLLDLATVDVYRRDDRWLARVIHGRVVDLHTLAYALSATSYTLEAACRAFGASAQKRPRPALGRLSPELIDYCRADVAATAALDVKLMAEFRRHPIGLDPVKALSPASIASAYLDAMGIRRPWTNLAGG